MEDPGHGASCDHKNHDVSFRIPDKMFFSTRLSLMTRAFGSPNTPITIGYDLNPVNWYALVSRLDFFIKQENIFSIKLQVFFLNVTYNLFKRFALKYHPLDREMTLKNIG